MYIIILGGQNDKDGNLSDFTKARLNKFFEIYELYENHNPKIIISGGYRFSEISHSEIVKKVLLDKYPNLLIEREFIENNNTVDEAINIANYFKTISHKDNIIIITSNWHINRAKYLFNFTFKSIHNIILEYHETNENDKQLEFEEKDKLNNLKQNPYGCWLNYINEINSM